MITLAKLNTYRKFRGDSDSWDRMVKAQDPDEITYEEWSAVDLILQSLRIVRGGMATPEFAEQTFEKLNAMAEDQSIRDQLIELAML